MTAITSPSLRELSEAAPKGPWALSPQEYDDWGVIRAAHDPATGFQSVVCRIRGDDDEAEENAARREGRQPRSVAIRGGFIIALEAAFRAGHLLDAPTVAEREARARAEGREEGVREAALLLEHSAEQAAGYVHPGSVGPQIIRAAAKSILALIPEARHEG